MRSASRRSASACSAAMRCCSACGQGAVVFLLFQQRCAGLLLEQRRVVRSSMRSASRRSASACSAAMRCVRPCGPGAVVFLLFQQRCAGLLLERRVVQPRCVQLLGVQLLPVQRRCALFGLRARSRWVSAFSAAMRCASACLQRRVVRPRCVQLLDVVRLLPVQRRCAVVRPGPGAVVFLLFHSDALGFCLSSGELFSLNAFSF